MALQIRRVVSEGMSVAASRNGAVLALLFFIAESLGILLFLVAGTMYVPVDLGTGLAPGTGITAGGELPQVVSSIAILLTGVFTSVVTIPISIVAIRTFVGGATDGIPDEYLFARIGRATLSGLLAMFLQSGLLFAIPFVAALLILALVFVVGGTSLGSGGLGGLVLLVGALVLIVLAVVVAVVVWVHFLFLLHEISVRHRGVVGAFRGSWDTVRRSRVKLAALGIGLVVIRTTVSWFGTPPVNGEWTTFQLIATPVSLVASAIVGVFVVAILARTYRELRPDVEDTFL